jgi:hypothetical protein
VLQPPRHTTEARIWTVRDVVTAVVLLFTSGAGVILYFPSVVTAPGSVVAYALLSVSAVLVAWVFCMSRGRLKLPDQAAICALTAVGMLFAAWYAEWFPDLRPGSDNAEALELGVRQLIGLDDPWAVYTHLGNPLSPMLGGFLVAAPFVLIPGGMYAQQLVWFAALMAFLVRTSGVHAAVMVSGLLLVSPHTRLAVPGGSDNWLEPPWISRSVLI